MYMKSKLRFEKNRKKILTLNISENHETILLPKGIIR